MDGDYCYRCESPVSMCMCEETITGKAEWQRWCRGRIAELEAKVLVMEEEIAAVWLVADIETNKVERLREALRAIGEQTLYGEKKGQAFATSFWMKHKALEALQEGEQDG